MDNLITAGTSHQQLIDLFMHIMNTGGPIMLILMLMSIIGTSVILMKLIQFYAHRIHSFKKINRSVSLFLNGQHTKASDTLSTERNPAAKVINTVLHGFKKEVKSDIIREEAQRLASRIVESLQRNLKIIELIASLSPLLGLLGTVLGIIEAFHQLELAGNNVDVGQLSGGIWVALITTAAGLSVGIPAVIALNWLEAKIERFTQQTEDAVTRLFTYQLAQPSANNSNAQTAYNNNENDELCESPQFASQGA